MLLKKPKKISQQIVFLNTWLIAISLFILSFTSYILFSFHNITVEINEMYDIGEVLFKDFKNMSLTEIDRNYKELIYEGKDEVLVCIREETNHVEFGGKLEFKDFSKDNGWYYERGKGFYRYKKMYFGNRSYYFFRSIDVEKIIRNIFIILILDLLFVLLSYIITSIGAKKILSPISDIVEKGRLIDENNLDIRLPKKSDDEIGELVDVINKSIEKIQKSYKNQKNFNHNASHELKTPLAIMKGYTEILKWCKNDNNLFNESLENINDEIDNMKNIVEKLLYLSKSDKMDLTISYFSVKNLFNKLYNDYKILNIEKIEIARGTGNIKGDFNLILEVMRALIDNALKFSDKNIILDSFKDTIYTYISVTDFGIGINEDEIDKIFENFYKVDESRSGKNNGLGLGLSIANEILKNHKATLIVKSILGEGSTFTIKIPN